MDKNIEKEFKILVNKEQFYELKKDYDPLEFETQINIYFDNEEHVIEKKKGAMRIRSKNNIHIFTLKMHRQDGLHEYECEVEGNDVSNLNKDEILMLLDEYGIYGPFYPTATLKTERAVFESEMAELCFDINFYNNVIDYEIEYEFKKEHDGFTLFNSLLSKVDLVYEENCKSKIQRALRK